MRQESRTNVNDQSKEKESRIDENDRNKEKESRIDENDRNKEKESRQYKKSKFSEHLLAMLSYSGAVRE